MLKPEARCGSSSCTAATSREVRVPGIALGGDTRLQTRLCWSTALGSLANSFFKESFTSTVVFTPSNEDLPLRLRGAMAKSSAQRPWLSEVFHPPQRMQEGTEHAYASC